MDVSFLDDEEAVSGLPLEKEILIFIGLDPDHFWTEKMQFFLGQSAEKRVVGETFGTKLDLVLIDFVSQDMNIFNDHIDYFCGQFSAVNGFETISSKALLFLLIFQLSCKSATHLSIVIL